MNNYGNINDIDIVMRVKRAGMSTEERYSVGSVVDVNLFSKSSYERIIGEFGEGVTGKIVFIGADFLRLECGAMFESKSVDIKFSDIANISIADKLHVRDIFDMGERYL